MFCFLARTSDKFRIQEMKQRRLKENTCWGGGGEPGRVPRDRESALGQLGGSVRYYLHFRREIHPLKIKLPGGLIRDRINFRKN